MSDRVDALEMEMAVDRAFAAFTQALDLVTKAIATMDDPAEALPVLHGLGVLRTELKDAYERADAHCAEIMGERVMTVPGLGEFRSRKKKNRTRWDKERLLRDVLDSRITDPATGEIADESPLDKVTGVWNLGTPRTTALRARGLNPDSYATVEDRGWTIQLPAQGEEVEGMGEE